MNIKPSTRPIFRIYSRLSRSTKSNPTMKSNYILPCIAALAVSLATLSAQTTGTWNVDANGNWDTPGNWTGLTGGVAPDAVGATANLTYNITSDRLITLNSDVTLGTLNFNDDTSRYFLEMAADRVLTFEASSGNATILQTGAGGGFRLSNSAGLGTIQLNDTVNVTIGAGTSSYGTFNAKVTGTGGITVNTLNSTDGSGTAVAGNKGLLLTSTVANDFSGGVTINSGFVQVSDVGNFGTGTLTMNASDSSVGSIGTSIRLVTGGGTISNNIVFGNPTATGGGGPRLGIYGQDSSGTNDYVFTGSISGNISGQTLRFFESSGGTATFTLRGDGSGLTTDSGTSVLVRKGALILDNADAIGTGNTPGTSAGAFQLGSTADGSSGSASLLTNGYDVGGKMQMSQVASGSGQTNNDNLIVGGIHTSGTATFSGDLAMSLTTVGSTRVAQLTSAAGGTTVFSGYIYDRDPGTYTTRVLPVEKIGDGTVIITANNVNIDGGFTVKAGTLLINNSGSGGNSGTGDGDVTVTAGTLGGTGLILGAVTVNGGTFAPGASIETLGTGNLTMNGGTTFAYEVDSSAALSAGADLAKVTGDFSLSGTVALTFADLALTPTAIATGTTFSLVNYTGAWNNGVFTFGGNALADGDTFTAGLNTWQIDYDATIGGSNFSGEYVAGNFVNVTSVVPEPSTWALVLASLAGAGFLRRRRSAA